MNAYLRATVLSLSVLGSVACTGMDQKSGAAFVAPRREPSIMDNDALYMARVEQIARRRGLKVVWVNVPRKPLAKPND